MLDELHGVLMKKPWLLGLQKIHTASMPILKVECVPEKGSQRLDITVQDPRHKGVECVSMVQMLLKHYPLLKPLLLVLKELLVLAELNDPYKVCSGVTASPM